MAEKESTPMGGGIPEERTGQADALLNRNCWAIDELIEEATSLFKTEATASDPNWLNANKVVAFHTEDSKEWADMVVVFPSLEDDDRVQALKIDDETKTITVWITTDAVLYDTRDPFGLGDAVLGLDRELTPDDLTQVAADLVAGDEGFTEGSL